MLAKRAELVYFIASEELERFIDEVDGRLNAERFPGVDDPDAPLPAHYVTTLYFDTAERAIARACAQGDENVKFRAREYSDHGPNRIRREPHLYLEIKSRLGDETRKVRVSVPHEEVREMLAEGIVTNRSADYGIPTWGNSGKRLIRELEELRNHTVGALRPDCLAHYRRHAWQDEAGNMRITLDTELTFYRAPAGMFDRASSLSGIIDTEPAGRLDCNVVEIKLVGDRPAWLNDLRRGHGLIPAEDQGRRFSKFLAASRAVHGVI